jgi:hypothetical protein
MTPRFASLLAGLALALTSSVLPLPAADPSAPLVAAQVALAPIGLAACPAPDAAALPAFEPDALAWDILAPRPAATNCQQQCDQLCAPLQGRCKSGSCFCLRDPL